jgi:hypothetical protein
MHSLYKNTRVRVQPYGWERGGGLISIVGCRAGAGGHVGEREIVAKPQREGN